MNRATATMGGTTGRLHWHEGLATGLADIDAEHRALFELVEEVDIDDVPGSLDRLVQHVVDHFGHQQAMMEDSGYPALRQHMQLHDELAGQVTDFLAQASGWPERRVQELRELLHDWLVGHIVTQDMQFGRWYALRLRQVSAPAGFTQRVLARLLRAG